MFFAVVCYQCKEMKDMATGLWTGHMNETDALLNYVRHARKTVLRGNGEKVTIPAHYTPRRPDGSLYGGGRNTVYSKSWKAPKSRLAPEQVAEVHAPALPFTLNERKPEERKPSLAGKAKLIRHRERRA